jgi:hypothetical protein
MVVYPRTSHIPDEPKLVLDIMKRNLEWFDRHVRGIAGITMTSSVGISALAIPEISDRARQVPCCQ